jgi:HEAT repeat protein
LVAAAGLAAATRDSDSDVRLAAARALLKVSGANDRSAGQALVALVADREPIVDRRGVLDLVMSTTEELQDQAATALAGLLSDANKSVAEDVMECLLAMGPRARPAAPVLERRLIDEDPVHRATSAIALATIGGKSMPTAIPNLLKIIDDLAVPTQWRTAAFGKIAELDAAKLVKVTPILIRQLTSKDQGVRLAAMDMLAAIVTDVPAELPAPGEPQ